MKNKFEEEIYFTPKQAACYLNLSLSTIKNYIYAGNINTLITPGGHHRISKANLLAAMDLASNSRVLLAEREKMCAVLLKAFSVFGASDRSFLIHSRAVSEMSYKLSINMGLKEEEALLIKMSGLVHDIGHLGIDRRILLKPGALTAKEYEHVKNHPGIGEKMLDSTKELKPIAVIVAQHHEKMDGTGYPKGLKGDNIQKGARIISITEAYDAMVSVDSYKIPVSKDVAIAELMRQRGSQFDGDAVESFVKSL
jgi:excisionase family DNA binding protein